MRRRVLGSFQEGPAVRRQSPVVGLGVRGAREEIVAVRLARLGVGVEVGVGVEPFRAFGVVFVARPLDA